MADVYVRRQWSGKVPDWHSDPDDNDAWAECPSCLSQHHANLLSCNGKREPCDRQCDVRLGEIRCERPANHMGAHDAVSELLRVAWTVFGDEADLRSRHPEEEPADA